MQVIANGQDNAIKNNISVGAGILANNDDYYINTLHMAYGRVLYKGIGLYVQYTNSSGGLRAKYLLDDEDIMHFEVERNTIVQFYHINAWSLGLQRRFVIKKLSITPSIAINTNHVSESVIQEKVYSNKELVPLFSTYDQYSVRANIGLHYSLGHNVTIGTILSLESLKNYKGAVIEVSKYF